MQQKGFATLEVILMVLVIGILASIAVPRFSDVTTKANTAKIQADLSTIDAAIAMYEMEGGDKLADDAAITILEDYLTDTSVKPPTGQAYDGYSTPTEIKATAYVIKKFTTTSGKVNYRATLDGKTSGQFIKTTTAKS